MPMVPQDARVAAIRSILTRLGKYSGLSAERLRHTEIDAAPLLELLSVRRHARRTGAGPEESILPVVREVAQWLPPTDRLIVDAALSLGLFRDRPGVGIDVERLYADNLGERREALTEQWVALHTQLDVDPVPEAPTVKRLRTVSEHGAFTALAGLLATDSGYPMAGPVTGQPAEAVSAPRGVVTVLGDAVIDHLYRVDAFPAADGAANGSFTGHPGGKGLNRAVAAARLGIDVHLVAAVGGDEYGRRILEFIEAERVRLDLIKVVPFAPSLVTAVVLTPNGESRMIGCRDSRVQLQDEDVHRPELRSALEASDVVILSFEPPTAIIEQVLSVVAQIHPKPPVIVCPTPSMAVPQSLYQYLGVVDYLVGTAGQLAAMLPDVPAESADDIARLLRGLGVGTVCTVENFRCAVSSDTVETVVDHFPQVLKASVGAAAAFTAALAYRLVNARTPLVAADYVWTTAAMIPTQKLGAVAVSMPSVDEIDRIVRLYAAPGPDQG
ncbi:MULTISPECIES: PfkB family carbohydrate kinase [Nocardia]|uniref:PfkB family carbohydrate kinase n=1 Tax=Nocardia TaxID=1817 RepID=UPI001C501828|nr:MULTISPECIES: PfkB family carbohydrate kinase [Nocardia]